MIKHRLFRQHCIFNGRTCIKDLSRLGRKLSRTIIVDNLRDNFIRQPKNGIEIITWVSDPYDCELMILGD
jgi:CTD small phosphatase-like protein 2